MKLVWDKIGERTYETGVKNGVLFPQNSDGTYAKGVAWNGLTGFTESPSGGEATPLYADDFKYLNLLSIEELGGTIEAYTYPDEFAACDGSAELMPGVKIGQQKRQPFGFAYKSTIGNDVEGNDYGYKIHLVYGCLASPSEKSHTTVNDSPEAGTFSWTITTTPVEVTATVNGKKFKPTASLEFDSTKFDSEKMKQFEDILYGTSESDSRLPLPDEVVSIFYNTTEPTEPTVEG